MAGLCNVLGVFQLSVLKFIRHVHIYSSLASQLVFFFFWPGASQLVMWHGFSSDMVMHAYPMWKEIPNLIEQILCV